jgi:DNA-binding TFAR19-related protein (PDSD5 family)
MSTPSRIEINQANSQYSTGPKTEAGKQRSSLNALSHGLTSQVVVMPTEDPHAYQRHLKSLTDEYHPVGATETLLTQALADAAWRLNRVAALEANLLTASVEKLANLSLHSQRLSRQFERTLAQLRDLQKIRRNRENDDLDNLLDIMEMYESKGETYEPSEDGFVFSQTQINSRIRARNRERLAEEAFAHLHGDNV